MLRSAFKGTSRSTHDGDAASSLHGCAAQRLYVGARAAPAAEVLLDQDLGDLNCIERRALAQVVGNDPQIEPMRHGRIAADTADIDRVLPGRFGRGHVAFIGAVLLVWITRLIKKA